MILVDAGPLVAIIDEKDEHHERCKRALPRLHRPLVTTWPAFTEAMHLLGDRAGWSGQEPLWRILLGDDLQLAILEPLLVARSKALMDKYKDKPMDLADATLVALAEHLGESRIFTVDVEDFRMYRLHGRGYFEIVPDE